MAPGLGVSRRRFAHPPSIGDRGGSCRHEPDDKPEAEIKPRQQDCIERRRREAFRVEPEVLEIAGHPTHLFPHSKLERAMKHDLSLFGFRNGDNRDQIE